ncbi:CBS domain-containing protein [Desulfococcus sp.]|uniref:CBS domain-containing protein n=1 Tax=Desulfococcus sp. TaxID=2025834 RepID=UPI0035948E4E
MLVKNWMSRRLITVDIDASMADAVKLMKTNDIHLLPVVDKEKLSGVVTDRDIKRASASDATALEMYELIYLLSKITVRSIMTRKVISLAPVMTVEEAAEILMKHKISGAPVVDENGVILGVITKSDLFRMLISLTGLPNRGIQFALKVKNRPGVIQDLVEIFGKYEGQLVNVLISHKPTTDEKFIKVYFRLFGLDRSKLAALKEDLLEKASLLYLVDYFENRREIYDADGDLAGRT